MKKYILKLGLSLIIGLSMHSCSQVDSIDTDHEQANYIGVKAVDLGIQSSDPASRATTTGYVTTFAAGDQIGVFAVKDGEINSNVNNALVTFDGTTWGNIVFVDGATYYAYYPYQSTLADFNASDLFTNVISNWTVGDDQSGDNYTAYDLMTASTVAPAASGGSITFTFAHQMSLAVFSLPSKTYQFDNTSPALSDYSIPSNGVFEVDGTGKTPYFDSASSTYRLLINGSATLSGSYGASGSYTGIAHAGDAGKYYTYTAGSGAETISWTLEIGDIFCADGSLAKVADNPTNAIGVVYYVGNPQPSDLYSYTESLDVLKADFPSCTHGLVLALGNTDTGTNRFATRSDAQYSGWITTNVVDKYINPGNSSTELGQIIGYNNTQAILAVYNLADDVIPDGKTYPYNNNVNTCAEQLSAYSQSVVTPSTTSGWYLPSLQELKLIYADLAVIRINIESVGGTLESFSGEYTGTSYAISASGGYYSSSERAASLIFASSLATDAYSETLSRNSSATQGYFRLALAF